MDFGLALVSLKDGSRVVRAGWNGRNMWLKLIQASSYAVATELAYGAPTRPEQLPWIGMKTADGKFVPWLASQTDLLANDWELVK